jgi:hypothetical protein
MKESTVCQICMYRRTHERSQHMSQTGIHNHNNNNNNNNNKIAEQKRSLSIEIVVVHDQSWHFVVNVAEVGLCDCPESLPPVPSSRVENLAQQSRIEK